MSVDLSELKLLAENTTSTLNLKSNNLWFKKLRKLAMNYGSLHSSLRMAVLVCFDSLLYLVNISKQSKTYIFLSAIPDPTEGRELRVAFQPAPIASGTCHVRLT